MKLDKGMLTLIRNNNANKAYGDKYSPIPCGPVIDLLLKEIERLNDLHKNDPGIVGD